ncbi:MAG: S-layer homology domain-containing protein [Lachnospiraceae bacterium]|nr:S-layer homology domain-containing protein [Lachnospiraceae bacterium]
MKRARNILYLFISVTVLCIWGIVRGPQIVNAASDVEISEKNFPDSNFREYVSDSFDLDGNGRLSSAEIAKIEKIDIAGSEDSYSELTGIEYFTYLKELYCKGKSIKGLDVSKNKKLEVLSCDNLGSTVLSGLSQLKYLECSGGVSWMFTPGPDDPSIDVRKNTRLEELHIQFSNLYSLDLSNNKALKVLDLFFSSLQEAPDLSENVNLREINCAGDRMTLESLDLSSCINLQKLVCNAGTTLKTLKISMVPGNTLNITTYLETYTDWVWTSSNDKAARVENCEISDPNDNFIRAIFPGKTVVTIPKIYDTGNDLSCEVSVVYKDVTDPGVFWYEPVYWGTEKGIIKGYPSDSGYYTTFRPANQCTRQQMVTFLWRIAGEPDPSSDVSPFSDVKLNDDGSKPFYYDAVLWAAEKGIAKGYKDGTFKPQDKCLRRQAVMFLWRMAGEPKEDYSNLEPFVDVPQYDDDGEENLWYRPVMWAAKHGITTGVVGADSHIFNEGGDCLRRQMVTFLWRYNEYIIKPGELN